MLAWGLFSPIFVFFIGLLISIKTASLFGVGHKKCFLLYGWHTIFCCLYLWYVLTFGGDAIGYYYAAGQDNWSFGFGTQAIVSLTKFLVGGLGLSIVGGFFVFNIFGTIGLLAFDACLRNCTKNRSKFSQRLATLVVFLPSVSFWSSGIGKDSLAFMATGLALWAATCLKDRFILMFFSIAVMLIVRPHIAGIMLIALAASWVVEQQASAVKRIVVSGLFFTIGIVLIPFALDYSGLGDVSSLSGVNDYFEHRQGYNQAGGGGIDISSMSLPMQLFTYMFRPMLFEVGNISEFAAALDNLIILFVVIFGACSWGRGNRPFHHREESRLFMWFYVICTWIVLAMTTANLGISLRQKWMFAPVFIYLLISYTGFAKRRNICRGKTKPQYVQASS